MFHILVTLCFSLPFFGVQFHNVFINLHLWVQYIFTILNDYRKEKYLFISSFHSRAIIGAGCVDHG
jgi:hypothetical protein